ncbi:MAG: hypothetical protein IIC70_08335 [Acidobacteria bacterium]|nr:hypothetical protein [Acidobacteriota bacterium]
MIGSNDVAQVVAAARHLPPAKESYLEIDFIMNLLETVLDYQMHTTAVVRPSNTSESIAGTRSALLMIWTPYSPGTPTTRKAILPSLNTCGATTC